MFTMPTVWPYFLFLFVLQWLVAAIRKEKDAKIHGAEDVASLLLNTGAQR
nr:hypothetical protein [Gluconobacter sp.]